MPGASSEPRGAPAAPPRPAPARRPRLLWASGLATLLLFAGIALHLAPLEPGALALQFAFTPRSFGAIVHVWPPADLQRYRVHLPFDVALLACYGTFGWLLARRSDWFATLPRRLHGVAAWLAPVAAGFDAAENGLHAWLTAAPRFGVAPLYAVSAACSTLKWLLLLAFAVLALAALARRDD